MKNNQIIKISTDVLSQEVAGETVLLDLRSEHYFGLEEVGTRFWQLLQKDGEFQAAYDTLLQEYDVDAEQLQSDLESLLSELESAGLIQLDSMEED